MTSRSQSAAGRSLVLVLVLLLGVVVLAGVSIQFLRSSPPSSTPAVSPTPIAITPELTDVCVALERLMTQPGASLTADERRRVGQQLQALLAVTLRDAESALDVMRLLSPDQVAQLETAFKEREAASGNDARTIGEFIPPGGQQPALVRLLLQAQKTSGVPVPTSSPAEMEPFVRPTPWVMALLQLQEGGELQLQPAQWNALLPLSADAVAAVEQMQTYREKEPGRTAFQPELDFTLLEAMQGVLSPEQARLVQARAMDLMMTGRVSFTDIDPGVMTELRDEAARKSGTAVPAPRRTDFPIVDLRYNSVDQIALDLLRLQEQGKLNPSKEQSARLVPVLARAVKVRESQVMSTQSIQKVLSEAHARRLAEIVREVTPVPRRDDFELLQTLLATLAAEKGS